jgi:delta 1-pyrroline-5-carboxylate dehydrogenase
VERSLAAVCGDTIVWKPSELTPLTAVALQHIANRVMADHGLSGVFTLAVGGPEVGRQLVADERLPLISFTGSTATGRAVAQAVAARLGRTILELGGNNAIVVAADADLDLATRAIVFGAVGTAGQRCTSTRRIIVQRPVAEELVARLSRAYGQIRPGDPLVAGTLLGPLVTGAAVTQMEAAVAQAVAEGGEVLAGGRARPDLGPQFVEPTLIRMPAQTPIVRRETFAPILYLLEYDTLDEAIRLHNDVPQGLSSAIFTDSVRAAEAFLAAAGSDCGIANVNIGTSGAEIGGAFGGEKETGGGRESGSDAWKAYMRRQTPTCPWRRAWNSSEMSLLSDRFSRLRSLPKVALADVPTPLESLSRLSDAIGAEVWVKRDDRTGARYGGNKVRKLEHLLGQAREVRADVLVTIGAVGSHHVLATALYGREQGFEVHAILTGQPASVHAEENARADLFCGAHLHPVRAYALVPAAMAALVTKLRFQRKRGGVPCGRGEAPRAAKARSEATSLAGGLRGPHLAPVRARSAQPTQSSGPQTRYPIPGHALRCCGARGDRGSRGASSSTRGSRP